MRVFRILLATLAVGLGGLAAAPRAAAAVHCVAPPAVSSCPQHTIGSALVLAAPGDTILLAPGTYYESSIEIPSGLDGLTISGASKAATILDIGNNTALGVVSTSVGFRVHSRKVTVKNMTVRNGLVGVLSDAPETTVTGMSFLGQDTTAVSLDSYGAQVSLNEFRAVSIAVDAAFGTIVRGNTITNAFIGVLADAAGVQILLNRIYNTGVAIDAFADAPLIQSNDLRYQQVGVVSFGGLPRILSNKVVASQIGLEVVCTNCFSGSISGNTVTDSTFFGLLVSSDQPGLLVQGNTILRAGPAGIEVSNPAGGGDRGVFLIGNKVADVGNRNDGGCFELSGDGNVLSKNQASGCSGSGFRLVGNENTLDTNTATNSFENGITVDGQNAYGGNYLTGNTLSGNGGDGIALLDHVAGTTVYANTATSNRKPVCDQNYNGTLYVSNSFADPGTPVPCDIVH